MKVLVTGGAGFIGSAVIRIALDRGHSIVNFDALTYAASEESLAMVASNPRYRFERADVRDPEALARVFGEHQPDCVMHLAAESHVDGSIDDPGAFVATNILGTYNLLEASRNYWQGQGCPQGFRFHYVATDEVYGSLGRTGRFTEETPYDPRSPYSASKAASGHLVQAWHHTHGLSTVMSNCSNNYGAHQFPEKLIPVIILNALAGKPLLIYGDGANSRDWLFVEDHAEALLTVLQRGDLGRKYNIAGENERSNLDLLHAICSMLDARRPLASGRYADQISFVADRPGHDLRYAIDSSRISAELGGAP